MANKFFQFKQFKVYQDDCAFKVTTDACILGAYPVQVKPDKICDIGTGTGVLSLMMAQKFPEASINAIEIDRLSAKQARENIKLSPWKNRIRVYSESIQDFVKHNDERYDLIICNPPYFENHLKSKDLRKNQARHNYKLSISELVEHGATLLKETGCFYSILPSQSFNNLKSKFDFQKYNLFDKLEIFSVSGNPVYRIISGFSKSMKVRYDDSLTIYDNNGAYTDDFKTLLKDYYLAF